MKPNTRNAANTGTRRGKNVGWKGGSLPFLLGDQNMSNPVAKAGSRKPGGMASAIAADRMKGGRK